MKWIAMLLCACLTLPAFADWALILTETGEVIDIKTDAAARWGTKTVEHLASGKFALKRIEHNPKRLYVKGVCCDIVTIDRETGKRKRVYKIDPKADDLAPLKWDSAAFSTNLTVQAGEVIR